MLFSNHFNCGFLFEIKKNIKGKKMLIINKESGGYLDGGPNHIRPASHGTGNRGWIEWDKVSLQGQTLLRNKQTGGYLDGGPKHMRPAEHGVGNTSWISWNIIDAGNGYFRFQNRATGQYLSGRGNHMANSNDDSTLWRINGESETIQQSTDGGFMSQAYDYFGNFGAGGNGGAGCTTYSGG